MKFFSNERLNSLKVLGLLHSFWILSKLHELCKSCQLDRHGKSRLEEVLCYVPIYTYVPMYAGQKKVGVNFRRP